MYIFVVTKVLIFVEIGYGKSKMIQCFLNRKCNIPMKFQLSLNHLLI